MPPSHRRSSRPKRASTQTLEQIWRLGLMTAFVLMMLPANLAFVGYGSDLAVQSYGLVKASMPLIPLGVVLMLAWRRAEIEMVTLMVYLVILPVLWIFPGWGWPETRNLFFAWPGLALGLALASASQRAFTPRPKSMHQPEAKP